ncbi:MAG: UDP-N-acetylmuramoyl-L-alanine--D-glutamate ligase [Candidatus Omnitrophica bacterium]|nr:UDP-N-acetylmuramoyl-L-alanine--D-glutamate ligase [Candidatus Omnitrophota bacterium]
MRNTEYFKERKVLVVGLARSGVAAANLLFDLGSDVGVTDNQDNTITRANAKLLKTNRIKLELGSHCETNIRNAELLVVSPGVPNNAPPVLIADKLQIPVISEIELGWMLCPGIVIAVTGSGGKTTVTTLIGKVIEASGGKSFVCGNIGKPFTSEVAKIQPQDFVILEISSFQLERIKDFKPKIAVMLNLSKNHLDRHADMQEYLDAKKRIFMNQDSLDYLVLNSEDPVIKGLAKEAKSKVVFFSQSQDLNPNQAAVAAVAGLLGIGKGVCDKVFAEFKGLEHRMEFVREAGGVRFINDSKATLAESCIWAIKNIPSKVILIAGGKDKGVDYRVILDAARDKVKKVIVIGEAREKIKSALSGDLLIEEAGTLPEAVRNAYRDALKGDYVLLSPMCSSFDMFSDYEERGRVFKEAVIALPADKS